MKRASASSLMYQHPAYLTELGRQELKSVQAQHLKSHPLNQRLLPDLLLRWNRALAPPPLQRWPVPAVAPPEPDGELRDQMPHAQRRCAHDPQQSLSALKSMQ